MTAIKSENTSTASPSTEADPTTRSTQAIQTTDAKSKSDQTRGSVGSYTTASQAQLGGADQEKKSQLGSREEKPLPDESEEGAGDPGDRSLEMFTAQLRQDESFMRN